MDCLSPSHLDEPGMVATSPHAHTLGGKTTVVQILDQMESDWNRKPGESLLAATMRATTAQTIGEAAGEVPDKIKGGIPWLG